MDVSLVSYSQSAPEFLQKQNVDANQHHKKQQHK